MNPFPLHRQYSIIYHILIIATAPNVIKVNLRLLAWYNYKHARPSKQRQRI